MAITFRGIKGSPLSITELDNNFREFYYSASYNNSELILYKSASGDTGLSIPFDTPKGPEYAIQIKKGDLNASGSNVYVTGSKNFKFDFDQNKLDITGSANVTGNLVVGGSVTAEEFITERNITIKIEKSGSTVFGDSADDTHTFTGALTINGTNVSSSLQSNLAYTTTVSSSLAADIAGFTTNYDELNNIPAGIISSSTQIASSLPANTVSASVITSPNQGTVRLTTNGVAATNVDLGLQSGDSPTFADLTLTGNLTVQGDEIIANVGTLQIEDKLLEIGRNNTQSSLADGGGIFISGANASLTWDHTNSYLYTNKDLKVNGRLRTAYLTFPAETGEVSEVLHSDGAGNLYFATASGGGGGGGGLIASFTNATSAGRVVTSVDAQNINAEAGLTFISGTLSLGDTDLREFDSGDTDVTGLVGGSSFGTILESDANGHIVMGIRDNDAADSFSIVTGNGGYYTGNAYTKLALQVKGNGTTTIGGTTTVSGSLKVTGDVTAYHSSDQELKDNIQLIPDAINKVKQIKGVSFDWNDKSEHTGHDIGVIAQDVERVLPELVRTNDTGYKAVRYEKIVALLIEAIKDQQSQINELKGDLLRSRS